MNTETYNALRAVETLADSRAADQIRAMNVETRRYALAVLEARREAFAEMAHHVRTMIGAGVEVDS